MKINSHHTLVYTQVTRTFKPGFHYPSWRPELTARVDGWPVSITRQHGRAFPLAELKGPCVTRQLGPSTRVVETGLQAYIITWAIG